LYPLSRAKLYRIDFDLVIGIALPQWFRGSGFALPRKEVIQPQVPLRLPCYDFIPITGHTLGGSFPKVRSPTSGLASFRDVTGGVYKARERIHRGMLIRDY
jgi:hypothetical protein